MAVYLKILAVILFIGGLLFGAAFLKRIGDDSETYELASLRRERNPGNLIFESEFRMAEAQRIFLIYSAAGSFLMAVVGGSLLWGVGSLHSKIR